VDCSAAANKEFCAGAGLRTLPKHSAPLVRMAVCDAGTLVTVTAAGVVTAIDITNARRIKVCALPAAVPAAGLSAAAVCGNGARVAVGTAAGRIVVWALPGGAAAPTENFASRLASSLLSVPGGAAGEPLPPREGHAPNAPPSWEPASMWRLNPETGELEPAVAGTEVLLRAPTQPNAVGDRHAVYTLHTKEFMTLPLMLKWPLQSPDGHSKMALTHVMQRTQLAQSCALEFNRCLVSVLYEDAPQVKFVTTMAVCLTGRLMADRRPMWALLEEDLSAQGALGRYNDSNGYVATVADLDIDDDATVGEAQWADAIDLAQALSCFSLHSSHNEYVLSNLHGHGTDLITPDVHWAGGYDPFFDPNNRGDAAIAAFTKSHVHNKYCTKLIALLGQSTALGFGTP
jgi:hypothetical protein